MVGPSCLIVQSSWLKESTSADVLMLFQVTTESVRLLARFNIQFWCAPTKARTKTP